MVSPRLLVSLLRKRGRVTVARQCLALKHQGSFLPESDERLLICSQFFRMFVTRFRELRAITSADPP